MQCFFKKFNFKGHILKTLFFQKAELEKAKPNSLVLRMLCGVSYGGIHITLGIQIPSNMIPCNLDAKECSYSYVWFHWESLKIPRNVGW